MPARLKRYCGAEHLHFITSSCYHRWPRLGTAPRRDLFLKVLGQTRRRYRFVVVGYVVMPEHFHLLIREPEIGDPSVVMKVVKERFARRVHRGGEVRGDPEGEYYHLVTLWRATGQERKLYEQHS